MEEFCFKERGRGGNPIARKSGKIVLPASDSPVKPQINGVYLCEVVKETPRVCIVRVVQDTETSQDRFCDGFSNGATDYNYSQSENPLLRPKLYGLDSSSDDPFIAGWQAGFRWCRDEAAPHERELTQSLVSEAFVKARDLAYAVFTKRNR